MYILNNYFTNAIVCFHIACRAFSSNMLNFTRTSLETSSLHMIAEVGTFKYL